MKRNNSRRCHEKKKVTFNNNGTNDINFVQPRYFHSYFISLLFLILLFTRIHISTLLSFSKT